ncbi:MAG: ribosomal protein S18-alanine N-acetyltransferase [Actinomycetota bacterium]|nr:ribosomal protein S18-alanine N-acetyltransferase [Actinomycetota bacterium]
MVQARAREERPDDLVVHLVPMRRRHLRSVLRIESQVYPRPWSLSLFMSELALRTSRAYYVARVGGEVVGYAGLMVSCDDGHVTTLAVDPAWHRRKIASRLLLTLAGEAIRRGAASLTLEVRVSNVAAQELYRRFGFRPAGIRKNYYVETNEDALVMWAHDVDSPEYLRRLAEIEAGIPGVTLVGDRTPGPERPVGGDQGPSGPLSGEPGPSGPLSGEVDR